MINRRLNILKWLLGLCHLWRQSIFLAFKKTFLPRASETCCGHIRCDFSGLEGSKPSSCTFYFFALKLSFCYSHGCNPHPGGILRSKANAPPVLKLVFLPMNILVSFDGEYHTSWINHKLFTNKCWVWSSQVVVLQWFEMIRWESLFKLNWCDSEPL